MPPRDRLREQVRAESRLHFAASSPFFVRSIIDRWIDSKGTRRASKMQIEGRALDVVLPTYHGKTFMDFLLSLKPLFLFENILHTSASISPFLASGVSLLAFFLISIWAYFKIRKYRLYTAVLLSGVFIYSLPLGFLIFAIAVVSKMKKAKLGGTRIAAFAFIIDIYLGISLWVSRPWSITQLAISGCGALLFIGGLSWRFRPIKLDPTRFATKELREQVISKYGNQCMMCGASGYSPGVEIQIDHIVPWSKGGKTVLDNLQPLCSRCNKEKSDN